MVRASDGEWGWAGRTEGGPGSCQAGGSLDELVESVRGEEQLNARWPWWESVCAPSMGEE